MLREHQIIEILTKQAADPSLKFSKGVTTSEFVEQIYDVKKMNFIIRRAARTTIGHHLKKLLAEQRIINNNGYYKLASTSSSD